MLVCYLILHYKNINDTRKCLKSLFETADKSSQFVVVDNGSGDGSGERLVDEYSENKQCHFVLLKENVGFSKGNNAGYTYIRENWNPDYIVVTNNDVVFYQRDFENKLNDIYRRTQFYLLGPDIYIPGNKEHQSPLFENGITVSQLKKEIQEYEYYEQNPKAFQKRLWIHAFKNRLCSGVPIIRLIYNKLRGKDNINYKQEYIDVGLQGSCLIVSSKYIMAEDKMFSPEPFLFCEEVFMYYKCKSKGYKVVYTPEIGIRHEEAASLKNDNKNAEQRMKFMLKHHVTARKQLLEYLIEMEK